MIILTTAHLVVSRITDQDVVLIVQVVTSLIHAGDLSRVISPSSAETVEASHARIRNANPPPTSQHSNCDRPPAKSRLRAGTMMVVSTPRSACAKGGLHCFIGTWRCDEEFATRCIHQRFNTGHGVVRTVGRCHHLARKAWPPGGWLPQEPEGHRLMRHPVAGEQLLVLSRSGLKRISASTHGAYLP